LRLAYVYNNTVYSTNRGIFFGSSATSDDAVVGNLVFAGTPIGGPIAHSANNTVDTLANAGKYVNSPSFTPGAMDFYPLAGMAQGAALDLSKFFADPDYGIDFNGMSKTAAKGAIVFRGAYAGEGANPGWRLQASIKPPPGPPVQNPAPTLQSIQCTPTTLAAAQTSNCSVVLSAKALTDTVVALSSGSGAASVPSSVIVPSGSTSASFAATAGNVTSSQAVALSASLNGTTVSVGLTINPAAAPPPSSTVYSVWSGGSTPSIPFWADSPVELGVKFRSDIAGTITGIRFYKAGANNGAHTGSLWSSTGALLASGTFTNETAGGWQQLTFATPVAISANTTYIASYHTNTGFAVDVNYFSNRGVDSAPLHALQHGADGANGVFLYGAGGQFPSNPSGGHNYWVDVTFNAGATTPPSTPAASNIWPNNVSPSIPFWVDSPVELGVKFRSDIAGTITGIRFYKAGANNGVHTGSLWNSTGTLLATGTFTNETAGGWQQLTFTTPVAISANTTYIASYHTNTGFAVDVNYFANRGVDSAPLHALLHGVDGANGVFLYGAGGQFPSNPSGGHNYWVDVVFTH
jgi:hypothetical protein